MSIEKLNAELAAIPTVELAEKARKWISDLCSSGARKWSLRVPPDPEHDPDLIFGECVRRMEAGIIVKRPVSREMLIEFLISKGWAIFQESVMWTYMMPPEELGFDDDFARLIPKDTTKADYPLHLNNAINFVCQVYGTDRDQLFFQNQTQPTP